MTLHDPDVHQQSQKDSLSGILARHVAATRYADLSDDVVHAFRRAFVDYLACTFAGAELPVTLAVRKWAVAQGSAPVASIVGAGVKLSASEAAFVNGAAAHGLDFDDGHTRGSAHPGGVIFSAALAVAERDDARMSDFIAGVVLGYDVMLRIASTMHPASAKQGWHNTPVAGVFGAAAAAARIAGLDATATRDAFGLAASFSGGLREFLTDGAEVKRLHPGKAARDGIVCAGLAAEGVSGAIECLEGSYGLFRAMIDNAVDTGELLGGLGEKFHIVSAYFKPYPCCRHFHAALDAVLELRSQEGLTSDDVAAVEIGLYRGGVLGHDYVTARNLLETQMSAPCATVAALMHGKLGATEFDPAAFVGEEAQRLLAATRVYVDDECERLYPKVRSGVVALKLRDGRTLEKRVVDPRGEGSNPLTDEDLGKKFLDNVSGVLGRRQAGELLDLIWGADEHADLSAIRSFLS